MLILTILKIIGITLLIILGIIFLLICIVLFVPVRYRAKGAYSESSVNVLMHATWLMHIVSAKIGYDGKGQPHITVKLLFFTLFDNLAVSTSKNKKTKKAKTKSKKEKEGYNDEIQAAETQLEDLNPAETNFDAKDVQADDNHDTDTDFETLAEDETASDKGIIQKIRKTLKKLIDFVQNMKYTFQKICDTIASIGSNIEYYLDLLRQDSTKKAFFKCRDNLLRVFKSLAPKKFQVNLHLGFDNPATLGDIMAVWGILYPFHQGKINILPEFEKSIIEGDFSLKGRISLFIFVRTAVVIFFDKNIRNLFKQFKR